MKRIGFTGTQRGMTSSQKISIREIFVDCQDTMELHHGDCIGADADAHAIFLDVDGELVVIHPPDVPSKRAWCRGDIHFTKLLEPLPYLTRNRHIVEQTELLIGCPGEDEEQIRSGTWSTIRYARKLSVPITIIYPDGRVEKENH